MSQSNGENKSNSKNDCDGESECEGNEDSESHGKRNRVYGSSTGLNVSERINNSSGSRSERNCNSESDRKGQQQ